MPTILATATLSCGMALAATASAPSPAQCARIRTDMFNAMKPTLVLGAGKDLVADQDPDTLQLAVIDDYEIGDSRVSDDGQVIYIARKLLHGDDSTNAARLALFRKALELRIRLKYGDGCSG